MRKKGAAGRAHAGHKGAKSLLSACPTTLSVAYIHPVPRECPGAQADKCIPRKHTHSVERSRLDTGSK